MRERHYRIWLVRHGATEWSDIGRHTGHTDLPLTDTGWMHADAIRRRLEGRSFALILSSPLCRALDTCRRAGFGDDAQLSNDLMEWDYGDYEGRRTVDIQKERPGWSLWRDGVPNGETLDQVSLRAERVLRQASAIDGDIAVFSHGHLLRVLNALWLGLSPTAGRLFKLGTGAISVVGFEHDQHVVERWNDSHHLADLNRP